MVVTVKFDGKLVLLTAIYFSIGIAALLLAFPGVSVWLPSNSSELASWGQAAGSILAIAATWFIASAEQRKSREKEMTLAVLDANTMRAEISNVSSILSELYSSFEIYKASDQNISLERIDFLIKYVNEINIRALSQQEKLAPIGDEYFRIMAGILSRIHNLKKNARYLRFTYKNIYHHAVELYEELAEDMKGIESDCSKSELLLDKFISASNIL